jgi:hypothetical protein
MLRYDFLPSVRMVWGYFRYRCEALLRGAYVTIVSVMAVTSAT